MWRDKQTNRYPKTERFSDEILRTIQPEEIVRYLKLKAYGNKCAKESDRPSKGRSSLLKQYLKSISHFLPDSMEPWSAIRKQGNPTRAKSVTKLVKTVSSMETKVNTR